MGAASRCPVQAQYLPLKGLEQLLSTIAKVRRALNPTLHVAGILVTMLDRTNYGSAILEAIESGYGSSIRIFEARVPRSTKATEASAAGISIFGYDPRGKVAEAYEALTREVLELQR